MNRRINSPACRLHRLLLVAVPISFQRKRTLALIHGHQAVVGDGDPVVCTARHSREPGPARSKGRFGIHHPLGVTDGGQMTPERRRLHADDDARRRSSVPRWRMPSPGSAETTARNIRDSTRTGRKNPGRQGDPTPAIRRDPAPRHQAVKMGGDAAGSVPRCWQHSQEADLCPQMLRVCGDWCAASPRPRGTGCRRPAVWFLEGDGGDRLGYGEHHVEVGHVEQFRLAVRKPLRTGVGGGEFPRIDGDVAGYGPSSFCGEAGRPCSRPSRTRGAASRWPSAILDCRCARRRAVCRSGRRDGRLDRTTG